MVLLLMAVSALTIGEIETTAGEQFMSTELAPERFRGRYLSVSKTSMSVQQAIGPILVTAVLVDWGRAGWLAIALILVADRSPAIGPAPVPGRSARGVASTVI
jgi:hypothetical protein